MMNLCIMIYTYWAPLTETRPLVELYRYNRPTRNRAD